MSDPRHDLVTTRKADDKEATQSKERRGWMRWVLGWLVLPVSIIAASFGAGLHLGARHPQMWLSELMLKLFA